MKTVIEMAREIADPEKVDPWDEQSGLCVLTQAELERFAELVRADEREACANLVWEMKGQCWAYDHDTIAAAIRARGNT